MTLKKDRIDIRNTVGIYHFENEYALRTNNIMPVPSSGMLWTTLAESLYTGIIREIANAA